MKAILDELRAARTARLPCALLTVAATRGSVPRGPGAKMIVYLSGKTSGTIGGGKFESVAIEDAMVALRNRTVALKNYVLREGELESFGAICGGELTVLIEPQTRPEAICLVGGGHCARAIAKLARECGFHVTVVEDRAEILAGFPEAHERSTVNPEPFIREREWQADDALVIVSRNYEIDQEALFAALQKTDIGYLGMIGSCRKVRRVFDEMKRRGITGEKLREIYAPLGLDIGADSPAEIAISVMAEVLQVLRHRPGGHLRNAG